VSANADAHILIVEDEPLVRWSLLTRLRNDGYGVEAVESGEEALAYFAENHVSLAVLDVSLPSMTGLEVLENLRECGHRDLIAIIITAFEDAALAEACEALDVYCIMGKPFTLEAFAATIERALRESRQS